MPGARKNYFGLEGFVWFIGVVEDRNDPEKMGRVRVRCFGWHTSNKEEIPTEVLPWAHPMIPVNSPAAYAPKEGEMVVGFFMDGDSAQNPVIMGSLPGKPSKKPDYEKGFSDPRKDFSSTPTKEAYPEKKRLNEPTTSRLSRGRIDDTVIEKRKRGLKRGVSIAGGGSWSEPSPTYAAKYPYNYVHESESGHVFELDDTKDAERVHLAHKIGSFIEMDAKGNRVEKVIKDNYSIVMGDNYISVSGDCNLTVTGDCKIKVSGEFKVEAGDITMTTSGDVNIRGSDVKIQATKDMDLKSAKDFRAGGSGDTSLIGGKDITLGGMTLYVATGSVELLDGSPDAPKAAGSGGGGGSGGAASGNTAANTTSSNTSTAGSSTSNTSSTSAETEEEQSLTSKFLNGVSEFASDVGSEIKSFVTDIATALEGNLTPDQLLAEIQGFESGINSLSGRLDELLPEELGILKDIVVDVASVAESEGLDLSLVDSVLTVAEVGTQTAKQLFPQTETAESSNNSTSGAG